MSVRPALKIDEEYLIRLAREKRAESRQKLSAAMTELFSVEADMLSDQERHLMFDILRKLIHDMETPIRKLLSEHLASRDQAPGDLVKLLANDQIEIARPILQKSHVLEDEDLVEIIYHRTKEHRLSVSMRQRVSEKVSSAIVEVGEEEVVTTLLENEGAEISEEDLETLVDRSRRTHGFQEPLLHRNELPAPLAAKMFHWVSAALRQYVVENWEVDEDLLDRALEAGTREELETLDMDEEDGEGEANSHDLDSPILLILALHAGELPLFVDTFRSLTGLDETLSSRILFEEGGEGLAVVCKAIGISSHDFGQIFELTRTEADMPASMQLHLKNEALDLFEKVEQSVAINVLRRWQKGRGYQSAMRDLELGQNTSIYRRRKYEQQLEQATGSD